MQASVNDKSARLDRITYLLLTSSYVYVSCYTELCLQQARVWPLIINMFVERQKNYPTLVHQWCSISVNTIESILNVLDNE